MSRDLKGVAGSITGLCGDMKDCMCVSVCVCACVRDTSQVICTQCLLSVVPV